MSASQKHVCYEDLSPTYVIQNSQDYSDLQLLTDNSKTNRQYWNLLLPTDAHNVKKHRVIKTF